MKKLLISCFLLGLASGVTAQCLAPLEAESNIAANPQNDINGVFKFDYKIESVMAYNMGGTSDEYKMDYYVNSADGSILFPSGPTGFFKTNLGSYQSADGRIDGAIWLPNGQMVTYVFDADNGIKRAITRQTNQSADDLFANNYLNMMQFFSSSEELAEHPEPLPAHVQWDGVAQGYRGELIEAQTGIKNTWTIYFDTAPTPIKTSTIMVGFMVGVLKDAREIQCNRLAIFTKVYIGGDTTGDFIQTELKSIRPSGITFDATSYQPLIMGGDRGTPIMAQMEDFEDKMRSIEIRRQTVEREKERCMSERCIEQKNAQLEDLRNEKSQAICQQMVAMGMESSFAECMRKENE